MGKGVFITLEGIEGAGKSTQAPFINKLLQQQGHRTLMTREPGGTVTGESIRDILLHSRDQQIDDLAELLLIFSARAQHLHEVIRPAIARGETVICDRFTDATYAYQGGGRGLPDWQISALENLVQGGLKPDLTLLFDVEVNAGLERAGKRSSADRFESESNRFFENVRKAYLDIAGREPGRVKIIEANCSAEKVSEQVRQVLNSLL